MPPLWSRRHIEVCMIVVKMPYDISGLYVELHVIVLSIGVWVISKILKLSVTVRFGRVAADWLCS